MAMELQGLGLMVMELQGLELMAMELVLGAGLMVDVVWWLGLMVMVMVQVKVLGRKHDLDLLQETRQQQGVPVRKRTNRCHPLRQEHYPHAKEKEGSLDCHALHQDANHQCHQDVVQPL